MTRIALGTVTISNYELAAINFHNGEPGLATREAAKQFIITHGLTSVNDAVADMEAHLKGVEDELTNQED